MRGIQSHRTAIIIFLWLLLFHLIANTVWLSVDNQTPKTDIEFHVQSAFHFYDHIFDSPCKGIIPPNASYPYLTYVLPVPLLALIGRTVDAVILGSYFWLACYLVFSYLIASRLAGRGAGLLAAFIIGTYPIIFGMSRQIWPDYSLGAMVVFAVWALLASEHLKNRRISIILGIATGLAMLCKITWFVFIEPLIIFTLIAGLFKHPEARRRMIINLLIVHIIAIAIGATWYASHLQPALDYARLWSSVPKDIEPRQVFSLKGFLYYLRLLINTQISFLYFVFFIIAGGVLMYKSAKHRLNLGLDLLLIALWIIVPYLYHFMFVKKVTRYTVPYLPAFAIITAVGLMAIKKKTLRRAVIALLIALGWFQYLAYSFDLGKISNMTINLTQAGIVAYHPPYYLWLDARYTPTDNKQDNQRLKNLIKDISTDWQGDEPAEVRVIFNNSAANAITFNYYKAEMCIRNLDINPYECFPEPVFPVLPRADYLLLSNVDGYDDPGGYVVGPPMEALAMIRGAGKEVFDRHFMLIKSVSLKNGIEIYLYKNQRHTPFENSRDKCIYFLIANFNFSSASPPAILVVRQPSNLKQFYSQRMQSVIENFLFGAEVNQHIQLRENLIGIF